MNTNPLLRHSSIFRLPMSKVTPVAVLLALVLGLTGCVPTSYDPADAARRCQPHGGLLRVASHDGGGWTTDGEGYCKDGTLIVYKGWNTEVVAPKANR